MATGFFNTPHPVNEPVKTYAPGSPEKKELKQALKFFRDKQTDVPMYIGGEEVRTGNTVAIKPPHDIAHQLGVYHKGSQEHVQQAVDAALGARESWANMPWEHRA